MWLSSGSWYLGDYPGLFRWVQCNHSGPHKLVSERGMKVSESEMEEGTMTQGIQWPPEPRKVKGKDSPLKPPERIQSCLHLNFSIAKPILDFRPPEK